MVGVGIVSWTLGLLGRDGYSAYQLTATQSQLAPFHTRHVEQFGKDAPVFNRFILAGVDRVQQSAPDGGGYFIGIKANPPESPIGYDIQFGSRSVLKAPRTTSYCSGSSYSAFVEGLNLILGSKANSVSDATFELLRMQEPDGGRREDGVKMWGQWNADGYGNHFALVQYSLMGMQISPALARPGDFMNISWKSGLGHSVVFLGFTRLADGRPGVRFWSSQKGTNGLGDLTSPLDSIREVLVVRLVLPDRIFSLTGDRSVEKKVKGHSLDPLLLGF